MKLSLYIDSNDPNDKKRIEQYLRECLCTSENENIRKIEMQRSVFDVLSDQSHLISFELNLSTMEGDSNLTNSCIENAFGSIIKTDDLITSIKKMYNACQCM